MRYLLVHDLDGCLYNYNTLPNSEFWKLCDEANALAAMEIFPELGYEKAAELAAKSFKDYHDCYGAFLVYGESIGCDASSVRADLFKKYHTNLFGFLEERHPNFFDHVAPVAEAFARMTEGPFAHAILSHSCMEGWGKPILKKMGLLEYFQPHLLLGMDDYGFVRKFESAEPMRKVINMSGYAANSIIFVEDSYKNTKPAIEQLGVSVALIHYDAPAPDPIPQGVRWLSRTPADLLKTLENEYATASINKSADRRDLSLTIPRIT